MLCFLSSTTTQYAARTKTHYGPCASRWTEYVARRDDREESDKVNLTAEQHAYIAAVREADATLREARASLEGRLRAELRARLDEELALLRNRRDAAAYVAYARGGVPKRRIGVEGMLTSAPATYVEAIENGRRYVGDIEVPEAAKVGEPLYVGETGAVVCSNDPFERVRHEVFAFTGQCDWQNWTEPNTVEITWNQWRDGLDFVDVEGSFNTAAGALLMGERPVSRLLRERALELLRSEG